MTKDTPSTLSIQTVLAQLNDIARTLGGQALPREGQLALKLDENKIAHYDSVYDARHILAADEVILHYRRREGDINLGAESFFFRRRK